MKYGAVRKFSRVKHLSFVSPDSSLCIRFVGERQSIWFFLLLPLLCVINFHPSLPPYNSSSSKYSLMSISFAHNVFRVMWISWGWGGGALLCRWESETPK